MKRNKFSLSHTKLLSCNMGSLIPVGMFEVLPGDSVQQSTMALVRASPLLAPVMHPVDVRIHHWYVPYRIIWEDFQDFITGGPDGNDASVYPTTGIGIGGPGALSLFDYMGIPPGFAQNLPSRFISVLPFRAYNLIWNENYRDQDLESEQVISVASGVDTTTNTDLLNCAWEKDYFTSARPWEQKGPSITIPLGTTAPVVGTGDPLGLVNTTLASSGDMHIQAGTGDILGVDAGTWATNDKVGVSSVAADSGLEADLSAASAVTINVLREALALQRFEEARARFGSRYTEYLRYLGVRSSDARLQRPEYLGGGRQTIQFSEVLQTAVPAAGSTVVGQLRGHGITGVRSNRYRRFFEEHGLVMSLMSVRPKTIYVQGINRMWNRRSKEDFWQKELETIGQQAVLNKEVYAPHTSPDGTFGYQDRYDEYRRQESLVAGQFRTSTLDFWHFARTFASDPALNDTFVSCVPTERTFAVSSEDVLYVMAKHSIQARRLVAKTGRSMTF